MLAIDRLVEFGGIPAAITPDIKAKLNAILPPTWSGSNPVDIVGDADPARYAAALELLLADPGNDAVLVMNVQTAIAPADVIAADRHRTGLQIPAAEPGLEQAGARGLGRRRATGHRCTEQCGYSQLSDRRRCCTRLHAPGLASRGGGSAGAGPAGDAQRVCARCRTAREIVAAALADGRHWLDPIEIKRLLDAYDIAMVPTFAAANAEQAVTHAEAIFAQGATVVLKIMSRDIVHKSDVGGVVLNLTSADAVRKATADILSRAKAQRPDARISGVMVQAMVVRPKARELILGIADDPTFGTVIVFGRGGTAVEIINDKALALPPLDLQLARSLIERTRVSRLLRAYRDVPAVKEDAVAMVLVKLSQMAADIPDIHELDINPLLADKSGVLAVDARIAIGPRRKSSPARVLPTSRCGLIRRNGSGISRRGMAGACSSARSVQRMSRSSTNFCGTSPATICGCGSSRR